MFLAYFTLKKLGKIGVITDSDKSLLSIFFANDELFPEKQLKCVLGSRKSELSKLEQIKPNILMLAVYYWLVQYELGSKASFMLPFELNLSDFSNKVLKQLFKQPYGTLISYKELAKSIGHDKACRAVGSVNNKNPLPIIIPCHLVVQSSGGLGGYGCGLDIKRLLLKIEGVKI